MLGIDVAGPTSLGTGTAKVLLGDDNLTLPAWTRSILAVRPLTIIDTPTAGEPVLSALTLESDDFAIQPYQVIVNPIDSTKGATGNVFAGQPRWYPLNCPVSGGSELKVFGNALAANTVAPMMACEFLLSDSVASPQAHARIGTLTPTGAVGATAIEPAYTITGARTVVELYGLVVHTILAAGDAIMGRFEFTSNDFVSPTPLKLLTNPVPGILGITGGSLTPGLASVKVNVDIKSPCLFENNLLLSLAPATPGRFITGVLFT